ncbi:hypothetical protein [Spongiibacter marinus]|uniref:hypothetical protein n=1 Tax=Spongiibacter marinus TaxID=354246 RepID=UPI0035BEA1F4
MSDKINLPSSSFDELVKIIKGYSHASKGASLDSLAKLTGLNKFAISGNNKFLSDISVIQGGNSKSSTDLGTKLARAIEHSQTGDARSCWSQAVSSNEAVSSLVTAVRIKGGMSAEDLASHVLYVSGQGNNGKNRTGSRTVVDVLLAAGLLENKEGILKVATPSDGASEKPIEASESLAPKEAEPREPAQPIAVAEVEKSVPPTVNLSGLANTPQIAINIQLHLPETDNAEVYEKLFKALKDNLLSDNS